MDDIQITIAAGKEYVTDNPNDAFGVDKGQVYIYIAPREQDAQLLGRRRFLFGLSEEMPEYSRLIPAYAYTDHENRQWRFVIKAIGGDAVLNVKVGWAIPKVKRAFIKMTGLPGFDDEGYDDCLRSFYRRHQLEEVIIRELDEKTNDDLYSAFSYLQKKGCFTLPPLDKLANAEQLTPFSISQAAGLQCRLIKLPKNWYYSDCGMLIAYTQDRHVVALYPDKGNKYSLYDPQTKSICRVTKVIAAGLLPCAHHIAYALPKHVISRKELFRFIRSTFNIFDLLELGFWGLLGALIGLLMPMLNQRVYDDYIPMGDFSMLATMCITMGIIMLGNLTFTFSKKMLETRTSRKAGYIVQDAVIHRFMRLPNHFFQKFDNADLTQRLCRFDFVTNNIVSNIVVTAFSTIFAVIPLIQMFHYSPKLAVWSLFLLLVFCLMVFFISISTYRLSAECVKLEGQASGLLYQFINGVEKIRMAGAKDRISSKYIAPFSAKQEKTIKCNRIATIANAIEEASSTIISMVMYYVVVQLLLKDNQSFSTGNYMGFSSAFGMFSSAVLGCTKAIISYRLEHRAALEYVEPVLAEAVVDESDKEVVEKLNGKIEVENLHFAYAADLPEVLSDINLTVNPGEYIGIVGESGCGKSTLLKLLLGFEQPSSGSIRYDGREMSTLDKGSLRSRMGIVLQNSKLLTGSIKDNIVVSAPHTSTQEIKEIIKCVGLEKDITSMPMKLETLVDENCCTISGGQKQRILIARALCGKHDILLFDEATSALDNMTQNIVCETLLKMSNTRIVIAHRLSTVQYCDRIFVFHKGRLIQKGSYSDLIKEKDGHFYQLAKRQLVEE